MRSNGKVNICMFPWGKQSGPGRWMEKYPHPKGRKYTEKTGYWHRRMNIGEQWPFSKDPEKQLYCFI